MQLRLLRTFLTVARTLNVTRAAAQLQYAQSSVTDQLKTLEAELDAPLFDRSGRRLRLTPAGELLIGYAERLLALADEARTAVAAGGEPDGELTIGAPETLCGYRLPPLLAAYRARAPRVRVALRPGNRAELRRGVRDGALDVCLTFGDPPAEPELASEAVGEERVVVVAPSGHRLATRERVVPADLAGEAFLVTEPGCSYREMFDATLGGLTGTAPAVAAELASIAALRTCVAAGMGCALVPEVAVASDLGSGTIAAVNWAGPDYRAAVQVTWRRGYAPASVQAFVDTARAALPQR